MKVITKKISEISNHKFLRFDNKYWIARQNIQFQDYVLLGNIFTIINGSVQTSHYTNEITEYPYIRIGDIDYKYGINKEEMIYLDNIDDVKEERILKSDDLILATIGATVGKIGLANSCEGGTHSNNTVVLRAKLPGMNVQFYEKLLQTNLFIKYIFGVVSQKAQPNLQEYDLQNINIPIVLNDCVERVLKTIHPIEVKINELKSNILNPQKIIDTVFQREFSFDYNNFNYLKQKKINNRNQSLFGNNPDLRFSVKFHRQAGDFVMKQLTNITDKKIKHFISEPIVLGASVSPANYSDDGEYYYISMATIKNWMFNAENASLVSKEYSNSKKAKSVKKNDIILARSGEGTIGKTALITEDIKGIFADFTMRIRLTDYNPEFAYYYFRTTYFQYLIEIYKKGLGNNTNIFPAVIQEFPLIDISLKEQQRIVDEIHTELAKQDDIKREIDNLRIQIDDIIENAIV